MLDTTGNTEVFETIRGVTPDEHKRAASWIEDHVDASKKKPSAEVVTLTPLLARLLLTRNTDNRPISRRNAEDLAADIANKRWEFNGESIVVSKNGKLLDGQHRCEQVVNTGKAIETVIVFGPRDQARFTIDTGKSKTVSNFLSMKGKLYTAALGPAINYALQWREHGRIVTGGGAGRGVQPPTKAQIIAAADELSGIDASVEVTSSSMKTVKSHAVLAFCHFAFSRRANRTLADEFMTKLIDGDGLRKGDPILYCRNRLIGMGRGVRADIRSELIFKCWNAWRNGQQVDHLKLSGAGKLPKVER